MSATEIRTEVPTGTWAIDNVHSTIGFAVKHMGIATFRGTFAEVEGSLGPDGLSGIAKVESVTVGEPNLKGHLLAPDFFDAERFPELTFRSSGIRVTDTGDVSVEGEITIKGVTKPIVLSGSVTGPVEDRLGLEVETVVDRREFGLNWNAPLPSGGFAVANDVTIRGELELVKAA